MDPYLLPIVFLAVAAAFTLSASAGFGGSLILVPTLALVLGTKSGVALAALLLAGNNLVKVFAYRKTLPYRKAAIVIALVAVGAFLGAKLLVSAPDRAVAIAVIVSFAAAFLIESLDLTRWRRASSPVMAFAAGATSGFSGTSGPLKGLAVRGLSLDRLHLVGALSMASLVGDATKTAVWTDAALLGGGDYLVALACLPLMFFATFLGRRFNTKIGERGYTGLFWTVMVGYTGRLLAGL
ncbi:sulfite exporter TauE/SafE family protein [Streptomyces sp. NBC_00654]|uniref:sulfite exporter TauE/SafE family protein n=1 Tax=Streptomyces sp. NBC_00654 TaxID=2975799 RepID=UPI002257F4DD|nr:sulfite exporter TauE/SafE family protein [Streptomyces sp. NBC_00654]MCX4964217.1 sulfite exporter TauE/SafE family protein [Streptomyces sp. NBC_00654]